MPQLAPINISIINASTVLNDAEIRPVVEALQKQVSKDFRPPGGSTPNLTLFRAPLLRRRGPGGWPSWTIRTRRAHLATTI